MRNVEEIAIDPETFKRIKGAPVRRGTAWALTAGDLIRAELAPELVGGHRLLSLGFDVESRGGGTVEVLEMAGKAWEVLDARSLSRGSTIHVIPLCRELVAEKRIVLRVSDDANLAGVYLRRVRTS